MKSLKLIANGSLEGETPQGLCIIQIVLANCSLRSRNYSSYNPLHVLPSSYQFFFCFSDIDDVEGVAWCSYLGLTHPLEARSLGNRFSLERL